VTVQETLLSQTPYATVAAVIHSLPDIYIRHNHQWFNLKHQAFSLNHQGFKLRYAFGQKWWFFAEPVMQYCGAAEWLKRNTAYGGG
jgi:hypothetical protein